MTSVHRHRNAINSTLYTLRDNAEVPMMITPKTKKTKDSTKYYGDRKKSELFHVMRGEYEASQMRGDYKELNLAYANTIHCFQGKTLSKGKLYIIMDNLFERSMFYVAISRVLRKDQIVLVDLFA